MHAVGRRASALQAHSLYPNNSLCCADPIEIGVGCRRWTGKLRSLRPMSFFSFQRNGAQSTRKLRRVPVKEASGSATNSVPPGTVAFGFVPGSVGKFGPHPLRLASPMEVTAFESNRS